MKITTHSQFDPNTGLCKIFLYPFRALIAGHVFLILYTLILTIPTWLLFAAANRYLFAAIERIAIQNKPVLEALTITSPLLIWSAAAPLFLVAVLLPIHQIWRDGKISIAKIIKATPNAIKRSFVSVFIAVAALFVIIGLIGGLYTILESDLVPNSAVPYKHETAYLISGLVFLGTLNITLALIIFPFISVTSTLSLKDNFRSSFSILENGKTTLAIIVLLALIFLLAVTPKSLLTSVPLHPASFIQLVFVTAIIWYFAASITIFCLASSETVASNKFRLLHEYATPLKVKKAAKESGIAQESADKSSQKASHLKRRRKTSTMAPKDIELLFR